MSKPSILFAASLSFATLAAVAAGDHAHGANHAPPRQTAWGIAGDARQASRTIAISMADTMRFTPDAIVVKQGEVVKFIVKNEGKLPHELVLGTKQSLQEHAASMAKSPHMEHDEPHAVHVAPGKTGQLVWKFNRAGEFMFGCLVPGHYPAGMAGTLKVQAAGG